ncbi:MAG: CocE/NonD family hydrolase [Acidimicrobiia bacterium]
MDVAVERDVAVVVRDGTVLRANVYRPVSSGSYPAVIERTPYGKDAARPSSTIDGVRAAAAGLVVVVQDVRGQGRSDGGAFYMFRDEFDDGYDTVEWVAAQPFCNGRVGCYGTSYGGNTSWQAAIAAPPSLGAIAPVQSPIDYVEGWDWLTRDGVLKWGLLLNWTLTAIAESQVRRHSSPDEMSHRLEALAAWTDDPVELFSMTPLVKVGEMLQEVIGPGAESAGKPLSFFRNVVARELPESWRGGIDIARDHSRVRVPAFITASWYDVILDHDLEHYARMRACAATDEAREQTRLLIGPWSHGMFLNVVGQLDYGRRAMGGSLDLGVDLGTLQTEWFKAQLGGSHAAALDGPRVKLFVQGVNRWRDEDDWPLARAKPTNWYLRSDGRLTPEPPRADEGVDTFEFDPNDPCPTLGGDLVKPPAFPPGPLDQAPIMGRRDVLVYTSDVLDRDVEVVGPVAAQLHAATTGVCTDFVVKLCDVHADGRTFNVCDGIVRTTGGDGGWTVDLWAAAIVFRRGHRIRVLVSSSDFPRYERNPNTGEHPWEATVFEPVRQRVYHDAAHASCVVLPVVG